MKIHVKGYLTLKGKMGLEESFELQENGSLRDLLQVLPPEILDSCERSRSARPDLQPQLRFTVLINGRAINQLPQQLETRLNGGDEVAIFPPMAGGN